MSYVDQPEISETYADSLLGVGVENSNVKFEFVVNRSKPPAATNQHTSCRLVIPLNGVVAMVEQLNGLLAQLEKAGQITRTAPSTSTRN